MTHFGNFGFLAQQSPLLAELGQTAEKLYPFDPSSCVLKLRLLAESLTQEMAAHLGIRLIQPTQAELLRAVDSRLNIDNRLEARLQTAQTATNRLPPSLLAKAFRGELVQQDPNDESASELLKRLAASAPVSQMKRSRAKATKAV
jgi:hypothetical protein